jgi:hypothetical protein
LERPGGNPATGPFQRVGDSGGFEGFGKGDKLKAEMTACYAVISFGLPLAAYWIVQVRRLLREISGGGSPTSNRPPFSLFGLVAMKA